MNLGSFSRSVAGGSARSIFRIPLVESKSTAREEGGGGSSVDPSSARRTQGRYRRETREREGVTGGGAVPEPRAERVGPGVGADVVNYRREELLLVLRGGGGGHGSASIGGGGGCVPGSGWLCRRLALPNSNGWSHGPRATDMERAGPTGQTFACLSGVRARRVIYPALEPWSAPFQRWRQFQRRSTDPLSPRRTPAAKPRSAGCSPAAGGIEEARSRGGAPAKRMPACKASATMTVDGSRPPIIHLQSRSPPRFVLSPPLMSSDPAFDLLGHSILHL